MNVITLVQPHVAAMGRNRKIALKAITKQLKKLRAGAIKCENAPFHEVKIGELTIDWGTEFEDMVVPSDTYFCISRGSKRLMTGWMQQNEIVHIMSWKRGFEAELFKTNV